MIYPMLVDVKQFTHQVPVPVVALHTVLITIMSLSMVMTLPTLG